MKKAAEATVKKRSVYKIIFGFNFLVINRSAAKKIEIKIPIALDEIVRPQKIDANKK